VLAEAISWCLLSNGTYMNNKTGEWLVREFIESDNNGNNLARRDDNTPAWTSSLANVLRELIDFHVSDNASVVDCLGGAVI
jgi:hypothetical protein